MKKIIYSLIVPVLLLGVSNVFATENNTGTQRREENGPSIFQNDPSAIFNSENKPIDEYSGTKFRIERGVIYKINADSNSFELTRGNMPNCLTPIPVPIPLPMINSRPMPNPDSISTTTRMIEERSSDSFVRSTQSAPLFKCEGVKNTIKVNVDDTLVLNQKDQVIYTLKNVNEANIIQVGRTAMIYYKGKDSKPYMVKILANMFAENVPLWPYKPENMPENKPGLIGEKIEIKKELDKMDKEDIRKLQMLLKMKGYFPKTVAETGVFGPTTKQAVIDFQKSMGVTATGYVGNKTLEVLNANQPSTTTLP